MIESLEPRVLLAADAITDNHPLWTATRSGPVVIDGRLDEPDWALAAPVQRTLASLPNCGVTLRMLYNDTGLKIGAVIRDPYLYADGNGGGAGKRWEFFNDDALALYFDVQKRRSASAFPASGRVLGLNPASMQAPINASGPVQRWDFLRGDPAAADGVASATINGELPAGLAWKARIQGNLRKTTNIDAGWTVEINIPWSALGLAGGRPPANGRTMGMNFQVFFDNTGGVTDPYDEVPAFAPNERYDRKLTAAHESGALDKRTGWPLPVGYAELQFVDRGASDSPTDISDLSVIVTGAHGARLEFTAPAATHARGRLAKGNVGAYQIRIANAPIVNETDWQQAVLIDNAFVPALMGQAESLRIGTLSPSTTYSISIRAVDHAGRLGDLGPSVLFTTQTAQQDPSNGDRIIVSPNGGLLATETGEAFPIIGGTAGVHNLYLRELYNGKLWTGNPPALQVLTPREGSAAQYLQALAGTGVNTLRLQLEWLVPPTNVSASRLNNNYPDGLRWLEWRAPGSEMTEFNDNMRVFLLDVMRDARAAGIRIILQTFNNFNYGRNFDLTPYASSRNGPIDSLSEFFESDEVLAMAKRRLSTLADWVNQSEHPETMIGFELYNEWDVVARPDGLTDDQFDEYRDDQLLERSEFMIDLAADVRDHSPELIIFSTTIGTEPTGPVARALFYSNAFDVLHPHFYTPSVSQPIKNTEADKTVRVAREYGAIGAYWLVNRRDQRPVHNGEWDLARGRDNDWPDDTVAYSSAFNLAADEANYRVASWAGIASGMAGAGLRIGSGPLADSFPRNPRPETHGIITSPLSPAMRSTQLAISRFIFGGLSSFDWNSYSPSTLAGRIKSTSSTSGEHLVSIGSTDGDQGLIYIVRDAAPANPNAGVKLTLSGMNAGQSLDFEVWSTSQSPGGGSAIVTGSSGFLSSVSAQANAKGRVTLTLPAFATDIMLSFRRS